MYRNRTEATAVRRVRHVLGLGIAVFAMAGASTGASAETLKVRLEWLPYGMHAPFHLATEKGWYKDAGLEVTIDDGNGSGPAVQLVAAGQYDISHANLATMAIA